MNCEMVLVSGNEYRCERCGFARVLRYGPNGFSRRCSTAYKRSGKPTARTRPAPPNGKPCGTCGPGILRTAANAVAAAGRVVGAAVSGEPVTVDAATAAIRLEVCQGCSRFDGNRCMECGCFVEAKAKLATEVCPLGKWPCRLLWRYPHGLGDHVQLTVALQHVERFRPAWRIQLAAKPGMQALFNRFPQVELIGLHDSPSGPVDHEDPTVYREPAATYADSPATKSEQFLRSIGIVPQLELCRYTCDPLPDDWAAADRFAVECVDAPYVVLHTAGHSNRAKKNLPINVGQAVIDWARDNGCRVVLLDWEGFAPQLQAQCVHPDRKHWLWGGAHLGTPGRIAALAAKAVACVGIDSGPGHVFGATDTPAVIYWGRHHPVNYYGLSPNVTHLIPRDAGRWIKGDRKRGEQFFDANYQHVVYTDAAAAILHTLDSIQ